MKNKTLILFVIILLVLIGIIIYFSFKEERDFKTIELTNKNLVINKGSRNYLDTITHVGLDKLGIENQIIMIREQITKINLGNDFETDGYIVYKNGQSIIFIKPDIDRLKAIEIIAHELIHLQQYTDGNLIILDNNKVDWNGDTLLVEQIPYNKRGWEKEAFLYGRMLEEDIKEILY